VTRREIRIAGFGGQGVITAGYVLANAAAIHDGQYALMTQSYGPEARGGSCKSDIIISDEPIDYPKISSPDCLVAMSIDAFVTFVGSVMDRGVVVYEDSLVDISKNYMDSNKKYHGIPAVATANDLGNPLAANMVMLGAVQVFTGAVKAEALAASISDRFPKRKELNLKALQRGIELGRAQLR
jgi:2-oxoglutarate ferredoxin oxidoreductase subunit gamma